MAIQIRRREFIVMLGGAVATCPLVARTQQTVRVLRVGFVGGQPRDAAIYVAFQKLMAELGYRDRYFTFEYIQTPSIDAYDASFRELVARKPDIVMAAGNEPALRAARAVAGTLPIVFLAVDFDPVERGYVASLARPGGNITGPWHHSMAGAAWSDWGSRGCTNLDMSRRASLSCAASSLRKAAAHHETSRSRTGPIILCQRVMRSW
jgi:ABC-type uncharacterized transport system substrate-binding protein